MDGGKRLGPAKSVLALLRRDQTSAAEVGPLLGAGHVAQHRSDLPQPRELGLDGCDHEVVGNRTRVKVVKNKVAPPFKQCEFDIMYGRGISREGSLLDVGVEFAIIKKSGAWFTYDGEQLGQGRENAKNFLSANPEIMINPPNRNNQNENAFNRGNATSGAPSCNGRIKFANAKNNGVAKNNNITVPCMVNNWLYCSLDRYCNPGRASSPRINMAIRPPTMNHVNDTARYIKPIVL